MQEIVLKVWFQDENIFIETTTGIRKNHPLHLFPRLLNATQQEREDFELSPMGIHWPQLDEDLSFEGFFSYARD